MGKGDKPPTAKNAKKSRERRKGGGSVRSRHSLTGGWAQAENRRRIAAASPTTPIPAKAIDDGSGTAIFGAGPFCGQPRSLASAEMENNPTQRIKNSNRFFADNMMASFTLNFPNVMVRAVGVPRRSRANQSDVVEARGESEKHFTKKPESSCPKTGALDHSPRGARAINREVLH